MRSEKPIPKPDDELQALCSADDQYDNFERVFRKVMSGPKAEVLKREKKEKHRNARRRASKSKS